MSDTKRLDSHFDSDSDFDFDSNFEVTYEEELPFNYDVKRASENTDADYTADIDVDYLNDKFFDYNEDDEDLYESTEDELESNSSEYTGKIVHSRPRKRSRRYGTKSIYRNAHFIVRVVSALITAGTFFVLLLEFWRGCAPYGNPLSMIQERNLTLASYALFAFVVLFYEFVVFFWSLTKTKVRVNGKVYREDQGRGISSFIFLYITSYLSFLLCSFLPEHLELGNYDFLNGLKGAIDVFGSMHNMLLGLCIAGVVSCIARRHMS